MDTGRPLKLAAMGIRRQSCTANKMETIWNGMSDNGFHEAADDLLFSSFVQLGTLLTFASNELSDRCG